MVDESSGGSSARMKVVVLTLLFVGLLALLNVVVMPKLESSFKQNRVTLPVVTLAAAELSSCFHSLPFLYLLPAAVIVPLIFFVRGFNRPALYFVTFLLVSTALFYGAAIIAGMIAFKGQK